MFKIDVNFVLETVKRDDVTVIAERSGLSFPTAKALLTGDASLSLYSVEKFAAAYGVPGNKVLIWVAP